MGYIKAYAHDIFVSYAHLDNQILFNQSKGWIALFCSELNKLISQRIGMPDAVKIWWDDRKLDGNIIFDQSIENGIQQSAILLCLHSLAYLKSDYCKKELNVFYNKARREPEGLQVGERSRIVNVLLNNVPYTKWPQELSGTTGFKFNDAQDNDDPGDMLDMGDPRLISQMKLLRNALVNLIEAFPKKEPAPLQATDVAESSFSIYFGEVADSLRSTRKRAMADLEKKGYAVVCGIPPPDEADAHAAAAQQALEKADLSVHLLDQLPGREIAGAEEIWYPQKQAQLGLQHARSQLIWVPAELDIETLEDEPYKIFMRGLETGKQPAKNIEYIRGAKSTLTQEITDLVEKLKVRQKQQPSDAKVAVLLDTHIQDQKYAWELSMNLLENQIQPFINPQEDDPRDNSNLLGERIGQVNKLVFLYGTVSWTWVQKRINAALKIIINNQYPVDEFFVFMVPPFKNQKDISFEQRFLKVNVIDNSDTPLLKSDALQAFYKNLKTVA